MFNIIFPIIIFISLAIIVFIVGKHLPEFVDIKKADKKETQNKKYFKNILKTIFNISKSSLIWLAEVVIKNSKNFLSLIQSWIADKKKIKDKDDVAEKNGINIERKGDNFLKEITKKEDSVEQKITKKDKEDLFFSKKSEKSRTSKKNFFINIKDSLKEKILSKKRQKINQVFEETEDFKEDFSQFSDGIVKIHKEKRREKSNGKDLINEVVEVKKISAGKIGLDEELGVDRQILEKKLINKIAKNPKDKEVYRQLGELYLKMKDYLDAEECYKQILKIAIRDIDAKRKIERIKLLKRSK